MLTLEFKVSLTANQQQLVNLWLEQLRAVWNRALGELNTFDEFTNYVKQDKSYAACCPIRWQYRNLYLDEKGAWTTKEKAKDKTVIPYSPLLEDSSRWYQKQMTRVPIPEKAEKKNSWGWKAPQNSPANGNKIKLILLFLPILKIKGSDLS